MSEVLQSFANNLREQVKLYREINLLEKQKQKALVANSISELDSLTAKEEKILLEVNQLEVTRLHWAEFFAEELGKNAEDITLAELIELYPSLTEVQKELEKEIEELQQLHDINTKLLQNAVSIVNFTIDSMTSENKTTYSKPSDKAKQKKAGNLSFIDRSI